MHGYTHGYAHGYTYHITIPTLIRSCFGSGSRIVHPGCQHPHLQVHLPDSRSAPTHTSTATRVQKSCNSRSAPTSTSTSTKRIPQWPAWESPSTNAAVECRILPMVSCCICASPILGIGRLEKQLKIPMNHSAMVRRSSAQETLLKTSQCLGTITGIIGTRIVSVTFHWSTPSEPNVSCRVFWHWKADMLQQPATPPSIESWWQVRLLHLIFDSQPYQYRESALADTRLSSTLLD